jgi:hypothetical protein
MLNKISNKFRILNKNKNLLNDKLNSSKIMIHFSKAFYNNKYERYDNEDNLSSMNKNENKAKKLLQYKNTIMGGLGTSILMLNGN